MDAGLVLMGVIFVIAGICIKPQGVTVGYSWFWGLAENSTPAGKAVFVLGAILLFAGIRSITG